MLDEEEIGTEPESLEENTSPSVQVQSDDASVRLLSHEFFPITSDIEEEFQLFDASYSFFRENIGDAVRPPIEIDVHGKTVLSVLKEAVCMIKGKIITSVLLILHYVSVQTSPVL